MSKEKAGALFVLYLRRGRHSGDSAKMPLSGSKNLMVASDLRVKLQISALSEAGLILRCRFSCGYCTIKMVVLAPAS